MASTDSVTSTTEHGIPSLLPFPTKGKGVSLSRFKTDNKKEADGVWQDVGGGLRLLIARLGNPKYEEYLLRKGKFFGRGMRLIEGENIAAVQAFLKEAMARFILLNWENLLEEDGTTPIPYSEARALQLLTDYPEFYRLVNEYANDLEHYRAEVREEAAKNS